MYQFNDRVRFSEMDPQKRMRLPSILRVMQDCSDYQSEALGVGHQYLMDQRRGWILLYWQVLIGRYPMDREPYTAETRPWKFDHFFGHRNFAVYDSSGERIVSANSVWSMMDLDRMRPVRPAEEDIAPYGVDEPLTMPYSGSRKIRLPEGLREEISIPVRKADLDLNRHVNNVRYIDMACEYLPEEIVEMQAEYRISAKLGDVIFPRTGEEDGWHYVSLEDGKGHPYAIVKARTHDI